MFKTISQQFNANAFKRKAEGWGFVPRAITSSPLLVAAIMFFLMANTTGLLIIGVTAVLFCIGSTAKDSGFEAKPIEYPLPPYFRLLYFAEKFYRSVIALTPTAPPRSIAA